MKTEISEFLYSDVLDMDSVEEGELIEIGWEPEKRCLIRNVGGRNYEVVKSMNIKLKEGDTFTLNQLSVGMPFCALNVTRGEEIIPAYVGAKRDGVAGWHFHLP